MARDTTRTYIELENVHVLWIRTHYGEKAMTFLVNLLLEKFVAAHHITPEELATFAADIVMEEGQ